MAQVVSQGRVIETRPGLVVLSLAQGSVELACECPRHEAEPGDYVWIYDDGQVEVKNRPVPIREISIPTSVESADIDHS